MCMFRDDSRRFGKRSLIFICHRSMLSVYNWASSPENLSSGFLTKRVSNQSPQLQRLAIKLKFYL